MGLFSLFRKKNQTVPVSAQISSPDITREVFIEDSDPDSRALPGNGHQTEGIGTIYAFLQQDYEGKGYSDALTNPDDSYKVDNIRLFEQDLEILIRKTMTYYEKVLLDLDFHIGSRSRAGLVDLVEELNAYKEVINSQMESVLKIREDLESRSGVSQRIALSYQRGFMRGLAAITQSRILNQN